jgi:endonuclease III-like uncharacterized protein
MTTLTERNMVKLFDHLWPGMLYIQVHRATCVHNLKTINNCFSKFKHDHNLLINSLCSLDGIGLTIASGLIWTAFPRTRVPFDKYTLTYALDKRILRTELISTDYIRASEKIKAYCKINHVSIEDFVRKSLIELEEHEYLMEPK